MCIVDLGGDCLVAVVWADEGGDTSSEVFVGEVWVSALSDGGDALWVYPVFCGVGVDVLVLWVFSSDE